MALDGDLTEPAKPIETLWVFFAYHPQERAAWEEAIAHFNERAAGISQGLAELTQRERKSKPEVHRLVCFFDRCHQSVNPNLLEAAVEETLIQHLLIEWLFRIVFNCRLGSHSAYEWVTGQYRV